MFAGGRGRGGEYGGGGGRGFGFGGTGTSHNPFAGAAQRFASGSGAPGTQPGAFGMNPFGGLGLSLGAMGYASPSLGGGPASSSASSNQRDRGESGQAPTRPKVAIVGTTASAFTAWGTLFATGYDVAVVAAGPDALADQLDKRGEAKLTAAAQDFVKGCITAFDCPRELPEEEKKSKAAAGAASAAVAQPVTATGGGWGFLGSHGVNGGGGGMANRQGHPSATTTAGTATVAAAPAEPEDPALRGVQACAWTQLMSLPLFDEVDVVFVTARAFPTPEKASAAPAAAPQTRTGALGSGRSAGSARSRASSLSSASAAAHHDLNPHDGLAAFILQCIERGKHVVLDVPAAASTVSVTAYVETAASVQRPKVCVMDRSAGNWTDTTLIGALRGLCGVPVTAGSSQENATSSSSSSMRGGRSASGRRVAPNRMRGRGSSSAYAFAGSTSAETATTAASAEATAAYSSEVGEACQLRLHVCVPREREESEATSEAWTRVKSLSSVVAQPAQLVSTAHGALFDLPLPPPPITAEASSGSPSSPTSSARDGATPGAITPTPIGAETTTATADEATCDDNAPLGVLGDIGYHVISFYLALFRWVMPVGAMASVLSRDPATGAPTSMEGTLYFDLSPDRAQDDTADRRASPTARRGSSRAHGLAGMSDAASEASASDAEAQKKKPAPPRTVVPARFYISNEPGAPLTQRLSVTGTKGNLDVPAPLFPLKADFVSTSTEAGTLTKLATAKPAATPRSSSTSTSSSGSATPTVPSATHPTKESTAPALAQVQGRYVVSEYSSGTAGTLQLRVRNRVVRESTLPRTAHPDAQLWTSLKQVLGLAAASGVSTESAGHTQGSARRGSLGVYGGGGSNTSPSSSYSRYRRVGGAVRHKDEPGRFPVQDSDLATHLIKSMWMTQQVLDSLRSATRA